MLTLMTSTLFLLSVVVNATLVYILESLQSIPKDQWISNYDHSIFILREREREKKKLMKNKKNWREGKFVIVGFDAANVMRRSRIQRLHQQVQRVTELRREK